jgi:hypothetical protein
MKFGCDDITAVIIYINFENDLWIKFYLIILLYIYIHLIIILNKLYKLDLNNFFIFKRIILKYIQ